MEIFKKTKGFSDVHLVVLCYNGFSVTQKFLNKLYSCTDKEKFSLTLIDNFSSDGTVEYVKEFSLKNDNMSLFLNNENAGVIGGRNIGFDYFTEEGKSKYIMFLDNDQFVKEGWFEQFMAVIETGYDMIGVEAWQMNNSFLPTRQCKKVHEPFSYIGCGGMMMKREVVEKVGKFDKIFTKIYFEDPDMNMRVFDSGFKIGWNICARIDHLAHQTIGKMGDQRQEFLNSYRKFSEKWKGRKMPWIYQDHLPIFDCLPK